MSSKANSVDKKQGLVSRTRRFFRSAWNELKKVHWPNKRQIITYTNVVIISVIIVAAMIWVVDLGLAFIMRTLI